MLTHGHPRALVGALAYGYALWIALQKRSTLGFGEIIERVANDVTAWANPPSISKFWPTWQRAADGVPRFRDTWHDAVVEVLRGLDTARTSLSSGALAVDEETLRDLGCFDRKINGAGTVSALAAIFLASKHAASPFEGVARGALAEGADTDTIASMTGALAGAIAGADWIGSLGKRIQDHRYIVDLAHRLASPQRPASLPPPSQLKQASLTRFLAAISGGARQLALPIGGNASVASYNGVQSKSARLEARAWRLESEAGQSFVVKSLTSALVPQEAASPELAEGSFALERSPRLRAQSAELGISRKPSPPLTGQAVFAGLALNVSDLELSRDFYGAVLGLEITREVMTGCS